MMKKTEAVKINIVAAAYIEHGCALIGQACQGNPQQAPQHILVGPIDKWSSSPASLS
jgi:hypothetical protein